MTFSFTVERLYSCTECLFISTKKHFHTSDDEVCCPLCRSAAERIGTREPNRGTSDFEYRQLRSWIEDEVSGVGAATVDAIAETYPDGDDFLDAAERAYRAEEFDDLTAIDGVGASTAESIARGVADRKGWEGGDLDRSVTFIR